jgi:hypothetical protein
MPDHRICSGGYIGGSQVGAVCPQRRLGDVWGHLWLSQLGMLLAWSGWRPGTLE